ncbi:MULTISPECIES: hypothetical protein [Sphingobacterium]|uniref:Uncharacterized protein n=1 Tax=Sphingobacterium populi TaxID=1812824 RepID=A0ABW5UD93_9SPHI|nr:hypothetical protein [Sphingobacterium sp. CFCC 11742]
MKQLKIIFIAFLSLTMQHSYAQVQPVAMDSLTNTIEREIRTAILEKKGFSGRITFEFNKNKSSNLFIRVVPAYAIDSAVLNTIADAVPPSLYIDRDSLSVSASYQFDEYTGELFFTSWQNDYLIHKVFGGHNTLNVESPGGTGMFMRRWVNYVHQLMPSVDTTTKYITMGKIRWLSFDLDLDGKIILSDTNPSDSILSTFFKTERSWKPSIHHGRRVRMRISLSLPEKISHLYLTHWDSDMICNPVMEEYAHKLYHKRIFVEDYAMPTRDGLNVISMINNRGKMASVRYHKGDLEACKDMEEQIREADIIKDYRESYFPYYNRLYFYTYQD